MNQNILNTEGQIFFWKALVSPEGKPINPHIWDRIVYFLLRNKKATPCPNCGGYHNGYVKPFNITNLMYVNRPFYLAPVFRKFLKPIILGKNPFKSDSLERIKKGFYTVGLLRKEDKSSNRIFGLTWLSSRNDADFKGKFKWHHPMLPVFFFTRHLGEELFKISIPMFRLEQGGFRNNIVRKPYQPSKSFKWKKAWCQPTIPELPSYTNQTLLVIGSPWALSGLPRESREFFNKIKIFNKKCANPCCRSSEVITLNNSRLVKCRYSHSVHVQCYSHYISIHNRSECILCINEFVVPSNVKYIQPLMKISGYQVTYLAYLLENNHRYWITERNDTSKTDAIFFQTNILRI